MRLRLSGFLASSWLFKFERNVAPRSYSAIVRVSRAAVVAPILAKGRAKAHTWSRIDSLPDPKVRYTPLGSTPLALSRAER